MKGKMIVIADSGATKTDWTLVREDGAVLQSVKTPGINVAVMSPDEVGRVLDSLAARLDCREDVSEVKFYGAGIVSDEAAAGLQDSLSEIFPDAGIECNSDLLAAARALFGDGDGVVAIMGTGSNTCMYERGRITASVAAGGYILGDEGGADTLGRRFLADYIKGLAPLEITEKMDLPDYATLVRRLYHGEAPSRYLASFVKPLLDFSGHEYVQRLVNECIESFVTRALDRFECKNVGVIGTYGILCESAIRTIGTRHGLTFVKFVQAPMAGLIEYHKKK